MTSKFVYKTYNTKGDARYVRDELIYLLLSKGYVKNGNTDSGSTISFRYPSWFFSSKKPLTCISQVSLETSGSGGEVTIKVGMTFTKIRNFTVFLILLVCAGIPAFIGIIRNGSPDFSPMAGLGIPAGFLAYYAVRGRVFRYWKFLVRKVGEGHGLY
jgi:hypothetical protein